MPNPYSQILAQLRLALRSWQPLMDLVREGNFEGAADPKIPRTQPADFMRRDTTDKGGAIRVVPMPGGGLDTRATSSSLAGVQNFAIGIGTDDLDADTMLEVKWQVELAVHAAGENLGLPDVVQSVRFVDLNVSNVTDVLNRGVRDGAWSAVNVLAVAFRLPRSSLL